MKDLISKELLSLVLEQKVKKVGIEDNGDLLYFLHEKLNASRVNLDTLGRVCKEKALL